LTNEQGICRFVVRPFHHQLSAQVSVQLADGPFQFEETLPVVPGAFYLTQGQGSPRPVQVVSPIVRDHVWYSLVSERGRGPGGRLSLTEASDGTAHGQLGLEASQLKDAFLVLSSDPDGPSQSAVGYPMDGQEHTLDAWDAELLSGASRASSWATRRAVRVRLALGGYGLVTILLAVVLFWSEVRREQVEVDRRMRASGLPQAAQPSTTPLVVAVLCVFFAFSATLVWIVTR